MSSRQNVVFGDDGSATDIAAKIVDSNNVRYGVSRSHNSIDNAVPSNATSANSTWKFKILKSCTCLEILSFPGKLLFVCFLTLPADPQRLTHFGK
jgi:hypothetical protein